MIKAYNYYANSTVTMGMYYNIIAQLQVTQYYKLLLMNEIRSS